MLTKAKRGLVEVSTSRKRIELQAQNLRKQAQTLSTQAQKAISMGREDLAREALTRKAALVPQLSDLDAQHAQLLADEERLTQAVQALGRKIDSFRIQKETIKAKYAAAQAQTRISEAFAGISDEIGDVSAAIARAEDKTAQLQARAAAVGELVDTGALDDLSGLSKDSLTRELDSLSANASIEAELDALKAELDAPTRHKELG